MAPIEIPVTVPCTSSRILRLTPSRSARARSDSERTLTVQTEKVGQSPASVKKVAASNGCGGWATFKVLGPEVASSDCPHQREDAPDQKKKRKSVSAKMSVDGGETVVAKTLLKSSKDKRRADTNAAGIVKVVRRANPGIRLVGGKVYDSKNGITCHQCRQKTMESTAVCKEGNSKCKRGFCSKCLFNRYGERVEEVSQLPAWPCPYCRGLCNCSYCRKKNGLQATGILTHLAKAQGFECVAALLKTTPKATQPASSERILTQTSPNAAEVPLAKAPDVSSPRKTLSGKKTPASGKRKRHFLEAPQPDTSYHPHFLNTNTGGLSGHANSTLPSLESETVPETSEPMTPPTKRLKAPGLGLTPMRKQEGCEPQQKNAGCMDGAGGKTAVGAGAVGGDKKRKKRTAVVRAEAATELPRPSASPVAEVLGVGVPPMLVGDVLQIVEFLATFAAVIDLPFLSEGRLLQELLETGRLPRADRSMLGQVQARLLSILRQDKAQSVVASSQWLPALKDHLTAHPSMHHLLQQTLQLRQASKTHVSSSANADTVPDTVPETLQVDCSRGGGSEQAGGSGVGLVDEESEGPRDPVKSWLSEGVRILEALTSGGYPQLSPADRVFVLKLLCDDALETALFRGHMEDALATAEETVRQQRKELAAAREEVKEARAALREVELTQLLGLKSERTPGAEQAIVANIRDKAARVSAALAAAAKVADSCTDVVGCRPMRLAAVGAHSGGMHYWKLIGGEADLMSQVTKPGVMDCDAWLRTSASELLAFETILASHGVLGKQLIGKVRAVFPKP